ncbi:MAG: RNA polymerase factor sigma-54 [Melioribacteraceae bacterium]|jgi:RNA polymerase sigma-54 factor|nr:RNA polymerase factor sigma-54 [Melioribacteraceae bacterium]RJP60391.1 MAG: RNA polymerase sigma-54 factor [Ignavibacteriales bacterium]WKZ69448.1 MAG: RNA polymerase factor sigma-54 [Melioribacteraceae bacterium]
MLSLQQKFSLQQKLSPQQIQYQKLLQLNTLALEQRIKTELELNPILEEILDEELELKEEQDDPEDALDTEEEYDSADDEFDIEDYMNDEQLDNDRMNRSPDEEHTQPIAPQRTTLKELLVEQLHMLDLTEEELIIGENIIGSLSREGYFKDNLEKIVKELKLFEELDITYEQAERVLAIVQTLEPVGIGARDLQECLLLQIRNSSYDPYYSYLAEKILTNHYKEFVNKRFDIIEKEMNLTRETLRTTLDLIQHLNPKPGEGNIEEEESNQITPDFLIEKVDNNYIVTLNDKTMPSLTISQTYLEMIDTNKRRRKMNERDKETHKFLREKFESAKWFIASIQQRRHTLMKIMRAILEKQYHFFESGPKHLKPMIYKDIADEIGMDISTISRVVNGKYVQSPQGIHELKYFFSEGLSTDSGDEISNKHIKELIKEIIDSESKKSPFSDEKISKMLQDKGIHIARRTVAKYREQLKLPVARLRKEL